MVEIPVVRSLDTLKCQAKAVGTQVDPVALWYNLTVLDPNPPGPLAGHPYVPTLPDDWMDGELFLAEAMRLYRHQSDYATVAQSFRLIPHSTHA